MRSGVSVTVGCPSVPLSVPSFNGGGGLAAERRAGMRYRSTAAGTGRPAATALQHGAQQQMRGDQCHADSRVDEAEHRFADFLLLSMIIEKRMTTFEKNSKL